jgi:hypothetical protein
MSTINSKNVQVGTSSTAAQNFTLYQPATPDGTVRLGVGNSGATTGDVVTVNSAGVTVTGTLTATTLSGSLGAATATSLTVNGNNISAVNSLGFRNRILNGGMVIDQRNAGASVTPGASFGYTVDRWGAAEDTDGACTVQQVADAPTGFVNSLKFTTTTADASLGATQFSYIGQFIEGLNVADLAWGSASAQTVTMSFWVKSSLTGTFGGALTNSAFNRSYPFTYAISAANTWEQKTVTIAGDTSGTWLTTNGVGIRVQFGLGVGSTYSGTAGSWAGSQFISATGATSVIGTLNATWQVTGVQLEAGTVASPFERRPYGEMLMLCQRYARRVGGDGTNYGYAGGVFSDGGFTFMRYDQNPVEMRSTISITTYLGSYRNTSGGPTTNQWALNDVAAGSRITWGTAPTFIALASNDQRYVNFYSNNGVTPSASVVGRVYEYQFGPTAYIILSSEL